MSINKGKINSMISAVQSGRTSPSFAIKVIGKELKAGIFGTKSEPIKKARGGSVKKKNKK